MTKTLETHVPRDNYTKPEMQSSPVWRCSSLGPPQGPPQSPPGAADLQTWSLGPSVPKKLNLALPSCLPTWSL